MLGVGSDVEMLQQCLDISSDGKEVEIALVAVDGLGLKSSGPTEHELLPLAVGRVDLAELIQLDVPGSAVQVPQQRSHHARDHRRSQHGRLFGKGVPDDDRLRGRRETQLNFLAAERDGACFGVTQTRERSADGALIVGPTECMPLAGPGRQRRREPIVAVMPGDFLHEVFLAGEVMAKARNPHGPTAILIGRSKAQPPEDPDNFLIRDFHAQVFEYPPPPKRSPWMLLAVPDRRR